MADAPPPATEHEPQVYWETLESPQGTACRKPVLSAAAHPQHWRVQTLQIGGWMGVIEPPPGATEAYDVIGSPAARPTSRSGDKFGSDSETLRMPEYSCGHTNEAVWFADAHVRDVASQVPTAPQNLQLKPGYSGVSFVVLSSQSKS
jgi:hypothetical protein